MMNHSEQHIGVFTTDTELIIRSWDDWLSQVSGIPAAAARGQPLTALIPDLEQRGLLARFRHVMETGVVELLAPALHQYLIPCPPQKPAKHFTYMQQRVTIAPLREEDNIIGTLVTIEDVTARRDRECELTAQLHSEDEATRLRAAQALAEEEDMAVYTLTSALGDASWRVRRAAVHGLVRHGSTAMVTAILRALRAERHNPSVLNSVLQILSMSNLDVVTPLIEFLQAPEADLRTYAAHALGEQRDPRAIPALLQALKDPDANVRYHAIEALGKLQAHEALDALLEIAESSDFFLAFPALDALIHIGDPRVAPRIVPFLTDELLCGPAAEALGRLGDETAVAPMVALLNTPGTPTRVIAQALASLYDRYQTQYQEGALIADLTRQTITPTGVQNLLDALPEANDAELRALALVLGWLEGTAVERALTRLLGQPSVRKEVIEALARHGSHVVELLIPQLEAEDLETRQAAVLALRRIGDKSAVPALIKLLNADPKTVIVATGALAKIGDRRAFEPLLTLLGHPSAAVRQGAIAALNSLGHPDMPARAMELLNDPDPLVRESAVRIAGYFGFPECADLLFERCHDTADNVRRAAIESIPFLEDIDGKGVIATLITALKDEAPGVRAAAARALGEVENPQAVIHLLHALDDAEVWVRYYAARSLGTHASPEALEALTRLAHTDPANMVRAAAMEALGQIGGARAVAALAPLTEAQERDLSRAALDALGHIGHPDALPPLLAALNSSDVERKLDAIRALGQRGGVGTAGALQWVAATDDEPRVTKAAIEALGQLDTPEAVAALIALAADTKHRETCVAVLSQLGEERLEWIAQGLQHAHVGVRCATIDALARMKTPHASETLITALEDKDPTVRLAAVTALKRLGSYLAERQLTALAHTDPDASVRAAARAALIHRA